MASDSILIQENDSYYLNQTPNTASSRVATSIDNLHREHLEISGSNLKKHVNAGNPGQQYT